VKIKKIEILSYWWGVALLHNGPAGTARRQSRDFSVCFDKYFALAGKIGALPEFPCFHQHDTRPPLSVSADGFLKTEIYLCVN
jgi:hypothetical protein